MESLCHTATVEIFNTVIPCHSVSVPLYWTWPVRKLPFSAWSTSPTEHRTRVPMTASTEASCNGIASLTWNVSRWKNEEILSSPQLVITTGNKTRRMIDLARTRNVQGVIIICQRLSVSFLMYTYVPPAKIGSSQAVNQLSLLQPERIFPSPYLGPCQWLGDCCSWHNIWNLDRFQLQSPPPP